jgi:hypothetical protein
MDLSSHCHLWVKICRRLLSLFIMSLLLHVATHKMPNLLDTYNTYIKQASFYGITMRSSVLERYQCVEVEKVVEIGECDDKDVPPTKKW